jgi:hypothetical protein
LTFIIDVTPLYRMVSGPPSPPLLQVAKISPNTRTMAMPAEKIFPFVVSSSFPVVPEYTVKGPLVQNALGNAR